MLRRPVVVFVLVVAAGVTVGADDWPASPFIPDTTPEHVHYIEEDEPGWDCASMGNRVCGPADIPRVTTSDDTPFVPYQEG